MTDFQNLVVSEQFGPNELHTMSEVFESVWSTVKQEFEGKTAEEIVSARTVIARNIIFSASIGHTDREVLEKIVSVAPTLPMRRE